MLRFTVVRSARQCPHGGQPHEISTAWRTLACVLGSITLAAGSCAAAESNQVQLVAPATSPLSAPAGTNTPHLWFSVGEQLRYRISWGVIPVGEIQTTSSWVVVQGQHVLAITCRARSNNVLRWLYPVEDKVVTTIDPIGFLPVTFQVDMKEGKHIRHEITTFDYVAGIAVWKATNKPKTKTCVIDPEVRDLLSLMYYLRKDGFGSRSNLTLRALVNGKVCKLPVTINGHETVKVPGHGNVDCLRLTPTIDFEVSFHKPNSIAVWISADTRGICTRASIDVPVGSITAELIELSGPGTVHWPTPAASP